MNYLHPVKCEGTDFQVRPLSVKEAFTWTDLPDATSEDKSNRMGYLICTATLNDDGLPVFATPDEASSALTFGTAQIIVAKVMDISGLSVKAQEQAEKNSLG
jgi:hypothetical protein